MSDTQEDVRLVEFTDDLVSAFGEYKRWEAEPLPEGPLTVYTKNIKGQWLRQEDYDRITARLEAYEALGSVEYLAALVREHEAIEPGADWGDYSDEEWDALMVAHDEAERLRGVK